MGSILYDFLDESVLFDEKSLSSDFSEMTDKDLSAELQHYREFCLKNIKVLTDSVGKNQSELKIFTGTQTPSLDLLKQSALYVEQFVICDPIFLAHRPRNEVSENMSQYLGGNEDGLDRHSLVESILKMKALAPMVAADFVKLLPTSYFFETPKEIPFYYSDQNYTEAIPPELIGFFHKSAKVQSFERLKDGMIETGKLYPCRNIGVQFENGTMDEMMLFQLFDNEILSMNDAEGTMDFRMTLPESPPEASVFNLWVEQSINRTATNVLRKIKRHLHLANGLNASYMTNSRFVSRLLHHTGNPKPEIVRDTANHLLKLELPFIEKMDATVLMDVRINDGESFFNFRKELEKQFRELRLIKDDSHLQIKTENALHELTEIQLRQVQQKVSFLQKKLFVDSAVLIGGLAGSVQTGGWSLLASAIATLRGYQTVQDYFQNTRQNPAFFLWRVLNKSN
jgi:hypothetical protein